MFYPQDIQSLLVKPDTAQAFTASAQRLDRVYAK